MLSKTCGCVHWRSERDIVALKCPCHQEFHPCLSCHEDKHGCLPERWAKEHWEGEKAIICRSCDTVMTIAEYMSCDSQCLYCKASFNPGCKNHWHLYFELEQQSS